MLATRLGATYGAVATAAPRAEILVTGYPILFEPPVAGQPNAATVLALNSATAALNATITATVEATAAAGVEITYVDVAAGFRRTRRRQSAPVGAGQRPRGIAPDGPGLPRLRQGTDPGSPLLLTLTTADGSPAGGDGNPPLVTPGHRDTPTGPT